MTVALRRLARRGDFGIGTGVCRVECVGLWASVVRGGSRGAGTFEVAVSSFGQQFPFKIYGTT